MLSSARSWRFLHFLGVDDKVHERSQDRLEQQHRHHPRQFLNIARLNQYFILPVLPAATQPEKWIHGPDTFPWFHTTRIQQRKSSWQVVEYHVDRETTEEQRRCRPVWQMVDTQHTHICRMNGPRSIFDVKKHFRLNDQRQGRNALPNENHEPQVGIFPPKLLSHPRGPCFVQPKLRNKSDQSGGQGEPHDTGHTSRCW